MIKRRVWFRQNRNLYSTSLSALLFLDGKPWNKVKIKMDEANPTDMYYGQEQCEQSTVFVIVLGHFYPAFSVSCALVLWFVLIL